uniref:Peptidase S1 domain-containing protein n=1 Tax=Anopheles arabiensis TaxID=7173 RepID=A0A182HGI9_ANOAR
MYDAMLKYYDIGLLKLETNLNIQSNVLPACLWLDDEKSNAKLMITRWNNRKGPSSIMKQAEIIVKDFESCVSFFPPNFVTARNASLLEHQMCILNEMEDATVCMNTL